MNCERFEAIGLDAGGRRANSAEQAEAAEHAGVCSRCAALAESWDVVREELAALRESTQNAETPARVQMRLLLELRTQKRPVALYRRRATVTAWALAAAALVVGVVSWRNWQSGPSHVDIAKKLIPAVGANSSSESGISDSENEIVVADNDNGAFTPLPGAFTTASESSSVFRVRMQRGGLSSLGLPVDEERASDWIQVDLLVGDDGAPEAVRLHQDTVQAQLVQ